MALANSDTHWLLVGHSPEEQERIIKDDIHHEYNIWNLQGLNRMPASALGCLCVMQVWGESMFPMSKERRLGGSGCFPLQKWVDAFKGSPYLSLANMNERDAIEFWVHFSATSLWSQVWKPWTESLDADDMNARYYYIKWLNSFEDNSLKLKWDEAFGDAFRYQQSAFGFEIVEILNTPDWLYNAYSASDPDDDDDEKSEGSQTADWEGNEGLQTTNIYS